MRKGSSLLLCFTLFFSLTGCKHADPTFRDTEAYDDKNGYAASLNLDYMSFYRKYGDQSNDILYYVMAQSKLSPEREIKISFEDIYNNYLHEGKTIEIKSDGINISDERMIFTFGKHFPVDTLVKMTGSESLDDMWDNKGQPQTYEELGGSCAFSIQNYNDPDFAATVYYGDIKHTDSVKLNFGNYYQMFDSEQSLQITEKNIYYFVYTKSTAGSYILVTQIPRNGENVTTKKISYSDLGLPELYNHNFRGNIFVDGDYLFFLGAFVTTKVITEEPLDHEFYLVAYNLKNDKFDTYCMNDIKHSGKLFRYENGLGLVTTLYDDNGYLSDSSIRFFDLDMGGCTLSLNRELPLALSSDWSYEFTTDPEFYCIGDSLCVVMNEKSNGSSFAYVEIDLKSGAVTTFIPFGKNRKRENKGLFFGSLFIYENGEAVSEHNVTESS